MNSESKVPSASNGAFTLIELLVVISIIGVLAGLLLTGVMSVKARSSTTTARREIVQIVAAINHFEATYSMLPCRKEVWDSSKNFSQCHDFTYGNGSIRTYGTANPPYITGNAELISVLRASSPTNKYESLIAALNPKKTLFLEPPVVASTNAPGVGPDGIYRDPWGNPYIISLDLDMSGGVLDGIYGYSRPKTNSLPAEITGKVAVWSLGPDGAADKNIAPNFGVNKDNVVSWEK
jgi:prepilin-type N-terminal cleavage/methylation domain-containing protein